MDKNTPAYNKLREVMIQIFGFDPDSKFTPPNPNFVWKWKSPKPIKRFYSNSGKEVK